MKPFELFEPDNIKEAAGLLSRYGDKASILAGGLDLVARMRRRQIQPEYVVSIRRIPGMDYIIHNKENGLRIGALTAIQTVENSKLDRGKYGPLCEAVRRFASVQVKTMGTVVGNLCVATPASDIAPALCVLDTALKLVGLNSERTVPLEQFYKGVGRTVLRPDEIVTEIVIPAAPVGARGVFLKLEKTRADIAKVNVAVMLRMADGICQDIKIALGSVAPTVIRSRRAESLIQGKRPEEVLINEAGEVASEEVTPITDLRSTAEYRREMIWVLVRRAITQALDGANSL
jgi:carbon-monoxide dehydrogenase medium subunit